MGIVFDKSLETGNELIDTEHKELIARVNKLTDACKAGKEKNIAVQTLDFLMDYTEYHFRDEETLQEENSYPLLDPHKVQHGKFVTAVGELKEMLEEEEGPTDAFVAAVKKNVEDWLVNHIQVWDKQVAQFIRER